MADGYYPDVKRLLLGAGCKLVRKSAGSHETWHSPITNKNFTVPRGCKRRHTANAILKDAGIKKKL